MSLLYKDYKDLEYKVDIEKGKDGTINFQFYADCGKHGTWEMQDEFELTAFQLLLLLQYSFELPS